MKAERIIAVPSSTDPYEECCVGTHDGDTIRISEEGHNSLIIDVKEVLSGIGPSYKITVKTTSGLTSKKEVWAYVDDDGNLNFYMKEPQA